MKIDDKFYIKQDSHNVILCFEEYGEINDKTGKPTKTYQEWFYKDLKEALRGYLHKSIDANGDVSMVLDKIYQVEKTINNLQTEA